MKNTKSKKLSEFLCSTLGHKILLRVGKIARREECLRCGKVWIFESEPLYGIGSEIDRYSSSEEKFEQEYPLQKLWDRLEIDSGVTYLHGDRERAAEELYSKLSELNLVKKRN